MILILSNLKDGETDDEKFNRLYDTYYRYVYTICANILEDDYELLKDVVQDVFLKVALSMHVIRDDVSAKAWISTIARNEALNAAKKKNMEKKHILDVEDEIAYASVPANELNSRPLRIIVDEEAVDSIFADIRALDKKYSEVLLLKIKFDYDIADIAKILGIKLSTTYARYERGLAKLKNRIAARAEV
ncbi:RNA polymerase sigma factor [Ructibacterium gallinarum]|uniref:Sigma-70 family RNA polymerase sigma factor n=1 Tax=Ructibacterium gallinarum TaxID=2779355 RepID=A0A9D5R8Y1_9FIRM|nr:sigma-70 family RNA polymerase sigma factor [Ructibacterium gallinarum]MBE5040480.1 sigma-70 family RNA polymerase sigma factor [Ructibacterium gallinarum]